MSKNIGMMDSAYFVGRNEVLNWVNQILQLNYDKIEQLGTGAAYCQILDRIYPGQVQMNKVNWKSKQEYEYLQNFKILTTAFCKLKIQKFVDVNKLVKCKYQDNLEMIQWLKKYYEINLGEQPRIYDPVERRNAKTVPLLTSKNENQPDFLSKQTTNVQQKEQQQQVMNQQKQQQQQKQIIINQMMIDEGQKENVVMNDNNYNDHINVQLQHLESSHNQKQQIIFGQQSSGFCNQNIAFQDLRLNQIKQIIENNFCSDDDKLNQIKEILGFQQQIQQNLNQEYHQTVSEVLNCQNNNDLTLFKELR